MQFARGGRRFTHAGPIGYNTLLFARLAGLHPKGSHLPTEGHAGLKNTETRLFVFILCLVALAAWTVATKPTRKGLDIQGGMRVVLRAKTNDPEFVRKKGVWTHDKLETVANIMRRRVDALGVAEPVVYPQGEDRVVVELPGLKNPEEALNVIQSTAKLEFRYVPQFETGEWRHEPEIKNGQPTGYEEIIGSDGKPVSPQELDDKVFSQPPVLDGSELEPNSQPELTPQGYVVQFEFRDEAKRIFEEFTRTHIGKPLAVFLDKRLISAPRINDVIPGKGIIEGNFTAEQAKTLANQLNAGALPVPLERLQLTTVEATLGTQAVHQTLIAGIVGLSLVLLFMLVFYQLPGLLADIALLLYALFTFALFKAIPVTLTVPGIAGFILSIGMAVDANILIFERLKEERKAGRSMKAAIQEGFRRAFSAIFDSNVCTLITCAILYQFGTGQVRGFAVTLALGVVVSMFTAITCSRTFLLLVARTGFGQNDALYGLNRGFHPKLQVTRRMAFWFGLSGAVIIPGLIFWGLGGIKRSIEFTGGTELTVSFNRPQTVASIERAVAALGYRDARVVMAAGNVQAYVTVRGHGRDPRLEPAEQDRVVNALKELGGSVLETQQVSGTISTELTRHAIYAVLVASGLIILYLAFRFSIPNFWEGLKFGTCAVIALLHDVLVLWGAFAIFGYFMNWEIDSLFVTAMLTVIGFSVHDTIVIFDRIRENLRHRLRGETFADVTDRSIEQTFARSVNTSGTVILTLLALLILGGPVIRVFVAALLIGVVSGTYSSIFNASPLLVLWKQLTGTAGATPALAGAGAPARAITPRSAAPVLQPRPAPVTPQPRAAASENGNGAPADRGAAASAREAQKPKSARKKKRRM